MWVPKGMAEVPNMAEGPGHMAKGAGHIPWYAFETQCCSRLEYSQWEQFPPEQSRWEHHWNKCRRPDNQIHHHEFPSS